MRTWTEKLNVEKKIKVVRLEKKFTDIPEGSKMLVATPLIVDAYVRKSKDIGFLSDYARGFGARIQSRQNLPGVDWHFLENFCRSRLRELPSLSFR